ncbi:hypothetical protein EVG20_g161 [Dentipellis fragilis]|uniref:Uncharacterized protein n=1 Tax=Dentipellis fragilis TaxID=205917 RepID=A0A4Y9ZEH7_9AGAM|nr:hypothetical protein EVG20_g161 [Dentipellis fragilis]
MSSPQSPSRATISYPPKPSVATPAPTLTESLMSTITLLFNTPVVPPSTPTPPEVQLTDIPPRSVSREEERRRSTSTVDSRFTIESTPSPQRAMGQTLPPIPNESDEEATLPPTHSPQVNIHSPVPRVDLPPLGSMSRGLKGLGVLDAVDEADDAPSRSAISSRASREQGHAACLALVLKTYIYGVDITTALCIHCLHARKLYPDELADLTDISANANLRVTEMGSLVLARSMLAVDIPRQGITKEVACWSWLQCSAKNMSKSQKQRRKKSRSPARKRAVTRSFSQLDALAQEAGPSHAPDPGMVSSGVSPGCPTFEMQTMDNAPYLPQTGPSSFLPYGQPAMSASSPATMSEMTLLSASH